MESQHATTSSISLARIAVEFAARKGVDRNLLLESTGLEPAWLNAPLLRVSQRLQDEIWSEATRATRDDAFGLHAAEHLWPGALDVPDLAARFSASLGEGYSRLSRYHALVDEGTELLLQEQGSCTRIVYRPLVGGGLCLPIAEFVSAGLVVLGRQATGVDWTPERASFQYPEPGSLREYRRLFRSELAFGARDNELVVATSLLKTPMKHADPALAWVLDRCARDLLEAMLRGSRVSERVGSELANALMGSQRLPEDELARKLGMSARELQRRLKREGTSYRGLLDGVRRRLAVRYLADPGMSIAELSTLLGFSEVSAFFRAFRRWTGTTPRAYQVRSHARPGRR